MNNATSILVLSGDGLVLAATRRGTTDQWGLIGGKQDPGETIDECAVREFAEETGIRLQLPPSFIYKRICEAGSDGKSFDVSVYQVTNIDDIQRLIKEFPVAKEVEPGIMVGFVPLQEIFIGPFGKFNRDLFNSMTIK